MNDFNKFCELLENLGSPTEARSQIAEYLKGLTPAEQIIVCNFLLGLPTGNKKIGISKKTVEKVLLERYGLKPSGAKSLGDEFLRIIEIRRNSISINDIKERFDTLSKTSSRKEMSFYLAIIDMSILQKKYFVDIMLNKIQARIGFGVIKYSLAEVYDCLITDVEYAYKMTKSMTKIIQFLNGTELGSKIGEPIPPQLAKDVSKEMDRIEYPCHVEPKYDGVRTQVHVHPDGRIQLFSRSMKETTDQFPDVVLILQENHTASGIYDGEIYGLLPDFSQMTFEKLQKRLNVKTVTAELIKEYPVTIVLFDIIYHPKGYHEEIQFRRSQLLEKCTAYYSPSIIVDHKEDLEKHFSQAIGLGYEGLMIKKMYAKYAPGEGKTNWKNWFKYKPNQTVDVLIINAAQGTGDRRNVLATFNIAVLKEAGVLYSVGNVGSGFTMDDMETLTAKAKLLDGIQNANVIIEVRFDKVSVDEDGEYSLRFPRFIRFRPDKMVHEIDTLDTIKDMMK